MSGEKEITNEIFQSIEHRLNRSGKIPSLLESLEMESREKEKAPEEIFLKLSPQYYEAYNESRKALLEASERYEAGNIPGDRFVSQKTINKRRKRSKQARKSRRNNRRK